MFSSAVGAVSGEPEEYAYGENAASASVPRPCDGRISAPTTTCTGGAAMQFLPSAVTSSRDHAGGFHLQNAGTLSQSRKQVEAPVEDSSTSVTTAQTA